ncbi:dedicator of cytokinesis protein [Entamoeba histolytica HM-3:IMSS]|uniref:Dedicator of cytokinesis protein n=1 Tax=Entamoeba histolytica HM-3:IMSS TaxID=885315 RepID=M7W646_ENTHI|nr:dedicator of cytokinesis protein [Entamoeba histolytica HM-3:IMSS]
MSLSPGLSDIRYKRRTVADAKKTAQLRKIFDCYDTECVSELNTEQLRRYFAKEKGLYLSQEDIKKILSEILQYNFRLPFTDFAQLNDYIETNKNSLKEKSNERNQCSVLFESQLLEDKDRIPYFSNILSPKDITFVTKKRPEQSHLKYIEGISSIENDSIVKMFIDILFADLTNVIMKKVIFEPPKPFESRYVNFDGDETIANEVSISLLNNDNCIEDRRTLREPLFDMVRTQTKLNITPIKPITYNVVSYYLCQITDIQFGVCTSAKGFIEPLYGYFAVYDYNEHEKKFIKITESFRVDINNSDVRVSGQWITAKDTQRDVNKFILPLEVNKYSNHELKGVLTIYKNAEADLFQRELYFTEKKNIKPREVKKFIMDNMYLQYVCVGFADFKFSNDGKLSVAPRLGFCQLKMEKEEDIATLFSPSVKSKQINGEWKMKITQISLEEMENIVDWNDHGISENEVTENSTRILQPLEMRENHFSHNLFIYPLKVTSSSFSLKKKFNSAVVKIYLQDTQTIPESKSLEVFYPILPGRPFDKSFTTAAPYSKNNIYFDEAKLKLPLNINDSHHLLFIVDDVFEEDPNTKETRFGFLPLFEHGHLIQNDVYKIELFKGPIMESYLNAKKLPDTKKMILHVRLNFLTQFMVQDETVYKLIRSVDTNSFKSIDNVLELFSQLKKNQPYKNQLIHSFPLLMKLMLQLFNNEISNVESGKNLVLSMLHLMDAVEDDSLKESFVTEQFKEDFTQPQKEMIFDSLTRSLVAALSVNGIHVSIAKHLNFFLKIIIKSLLFWMQKEDLFEKENRFQLIAIQYSQISTQFKTELINLFEQLAIFIRKSVQSKRYSYLNYVNYIIGQFLKDLLRFYSRTTTMEALESYINTLSCFYENKSTTLFNPKNSKYGNESDESWKIIQLLKIDFIRDLHQFVYFYEINVPTISPMTSCAKFIENIFNKHYFVEFTVQHLTDSMARDDSVCKYALMVLAEQIIKMDTYRGWTEEERSCIAEMYFSYVNYVCIEYKRMVSRWHRAQTVTTTHAQVDDVSTTNSSEVVLEQSPEISGNYLQILYLLFFWVFKNLSHQTLSDLIRKTNQSLLKTILTVTKDGLNVIGSLKNNKTFLMNEFADMFRKSRDELCEGKDLGTIPYVYSLTSSCDLLLGNEMIIDNVNLVALEIVDTIFKMYSTRDDLPVVSILFYVLGKSLFNTCMTNTYYPLFLSYIRFIIREKTEFLFQSNSRLAFDIVNGLICLCTKKIAPLRQEAIATLYLFTKKDYERNDKSTRITQIHIISSLFDLHLHSNESISSVNNEASDGFIHKAIELLGKWAKEDFASKKRLSVDQTQVIESNKMIDSQLDTWIKFSDEEKLRLVNSIQKEIQSVGKRRCVLRGLEYLKEIWTENSKVLNQINKLCTEVIPLVEQEDQGFILERKASDLASEWMVSMRDATALLTKEDVDIESLNNMQVSLQKQTTTLIDLIKQIEKLGSKFDLSQRNLMIAMQMVIDLNKIRLKGLQAETSTKNSTHEQAMNFIEKQEKNRLEIAGEYKKIKNDAETKGTLLEVAEYTLQQYRLMQDNIDRRHRQMKEEDLQCNGMPGWETVFVQWETILPKAVSLLNELIEIQTILDGLNKNEIIHKEDIYAEFAASEQLIKICAWCIEVNETIHFPVECVSELPQRILVANELMKQFTSIEKMIQFVKTEYGDAENKQQKKYMFDELFKQYVEKDNWKSSLARKIQEMQDIYQKETDREQRETEYKKLLQRVIQLIQMGDDYQEDVSKACERIIELEKIDSNVVDVISDDDFKILQKLKETKKGYSSLLKGFGKKTPMEKKEESSSDQFISELKILEGQTNSILCELQKLNELEEKNYGNDVVMEKYLSIADNSMESPYFHLKWYNTIYMKQKELENYMEAGVAAVHEIYFIYKAIIEPSGIILKESYLREITEDFLHYKTSSVGLSSTVLDDNTNSFVSAVDDAIEMFEKADHRKFAIALCNFIIPYFANNHEYNALAEKHKMIHKMYYEMRTTISLPFYFYSVRFLGKIFKSRDNDTNEIFNIVDSQKALSAIKPKTVNDNDSVSSTDSREIILDCENEYIYMSKQKLVEFKQYLETLHKTSGAIVMSEAEAEKEQIDPNGDKPVIILNNVKCFVDGRVSNDFVKCNTFVNEIAKGKGAEVVKTRRIITTYRYFPSVMEREAVIKKTEITLSPVETGIADVDMMIQGLNNDICKLKSDKNASVSGLQRLLMGILSANVNGGIGLYLTYFLSKENIHKYKENELAELFLIIERIMALSKEGLMIHKNKMKVENAQIQNVMEEGYLQLEKLTKEVRKTLTEAGIL